MGNKAYRAGAIRISGGSTGPVGLVRRAAIAGAAALVGFASPALAESVSMDGVFPAANREASMLRSIAVERFGGRDGVAMALAVERALASATLEGRPYFTVLASRRGMDGAPAGPRDGFLSGVAGATVNETRTQQEREDCVEKDANGKCIRREKRKVDCRRRIIDFSADVRLARANDGAIIYSTMIPAREEITICPDSGQPRLAEDVIRGMINDVANQIRRDFAPREERYSIRFRENRTGLSKPLGERFKAALKATKRDVPAACAIWREIDAEAPNQPSVVFDLALCAEAAGNLTDAAMLYGRARGLVGRNTADVDAGLDRVRQLQAAQADLAERSGKRR